MTQLMKKLQKKAKGAWHEKLFYMIMPERIVPSIQRWVDLYDINIKNRVKKNKRQMPANPSKHVLLHIITTTYITFNDYSVTFTPEGWPSGWANVYDMTCQHFHCLLCYFFTPLH